MPRFIHAADLHLDSPLRGLERYEGAPVDRIRSATRRALNRLVDTAIQESIDFLVIAGDVYDGDWQDHNTGLHFIAQMQKLVDHEIPVVMIRGNHDAANRMTRSLSLPEGVHLLGIDKPETVVLDDLGVAIHGQSFGTAAESRNLVQQYPDSEPGLFNLGLLHTSLTGGEGHDNYAPCTPADLASRGYHYWALGHIHRRDDQTYRDPAIVFPGNLQGRHARETGPKGAVLVETKGDSVESIEFKPLDVLRWERCRVETQGLEDGDDLLRKVDEALRELLTLNDPLPLAVRVEIDGPCSFHRELVADIDHWRQEVRARGIQVDAERLWIEKVRVTTRLPQKAVFSDRDEGPLEELWGRLAQLQGSDKDWGATVQELEALQKKLPPAVAKRVSEIIQGDDETRRTFLQSVQSRLEGRLFDVEGDE